MTFDAREDSAEDGDPILLVTFMLGGKIWRQVRGDQPYTYNGNTYDPVPGGIDPSAIQDSGETAKNDIKLTVDRLHPIAELWRVSPPTAVLAVTLVEIHDGDPENAVAWLGHVANVGWVGEARADITLTPGTMALKTNGLRRLWCKNCTHALYGDACGLDRAEHSVAATVATIEGNVLTADELANGMKFTGGYIAWTDADGVTDYRFISAHNGTTLELMTGAVRLAVGDSITAFEGCDHTLRRCDELGNVSRYGGIPYFLGKNPFDNNPVY